MLVFLFSFLMPTRYPTSFVQIRLVFIIDYYCSLLFLFSRSILCPFCRLALSSSTPTRISRAQVPVHSRDPTKFQHQGFGVLLMEEAERIARDEHGSVKLAVISGAYPYRAFSCLLERLACGRLF